VCLANADTLELVNRWFAHDRYIEAVAFSPDGRRLYTVARTLEVKVWAVPTGEHLATLSTSAICSHRTLLLDPAADVGFIVQLDRSIQSFCEKSLELCTRYAEAPAGINCILFEPHRHRLLAGDDHGHIVAWTEGRPAPIHIVPVGCSAIRAMDLHAASDRLLTASHDGTLTLADLETLQPIARFRTDSPAVEVMFADQGRSIVAGCRSGDVHILRVIEQKARSKSLQALKPRW